MENENDLEKQKLELEKQRLELEKQKFEFEKQERLKSNKTENINYNSKSNSSSNLNYGKKPSLGEYIGYIGALILLISCFLPWVSSSSSFLGKKVFSSSINSFSIGHGYLILLCSIACFFMINQKIKLIYIPLLLVVIDSLSVMFGIGSFKLSGYGVKSTTGVSFGPILAIISCVVIYFSNFFDNKEIKTSEFFKNSVSSISLKGIGDNFVKYKLEILSVIFIFLVIIPILIDYTLIMTDYFYNFIVYFFIPILILSINGMNKSRKFFIPLFFFIILRVYFDQKYFLGRDFSQFDFAGNYYFEEYKSWFKFIFYTVFILVFVIEYQSIKNKYLINFDKFSKYLKFIKLKYFYSFLFLPFIILLFYNFIFKHKVTQIEVEKFKESLNLIEGDWYFFNADSTDYYKLSIGVNPIENEIRSLKYGSEELQTNINYLVEQKNTVLLKNNLVYKNIYNQLFKLPYKLSDSVKIIKRNKDKIKVEICLPNSKKQIKYCTNSIKEIKEELKKNFLKSYYTAICQVENSGDQEVSKCKWGIYEFFTKKEFDSGECKFGCEKKFIIRSGTSKIGIKNLFYRDQDALSLLSKNLSKEFYKMQTQNFDCMEDTEFSLTSWSQINYVPQDDGMLFSIVLDVPKYCQGTNGEVSFFWPYKEMLSYIYLN